MKDLKLPALYRADGWCVTDKDFHDALEIRGISGRIISAASAIDQVVAEIISNTIFREVQEHREVVLGSVLSSDWCTFSAKRKLLKVALEVFQLVEGSIKNSLDENLGKVMRYRNAFAHGTLGLNSDTFKQELHYFESEPRKSILDDEYFTKLEKTFQDVWAELMKIQEMLDKKGND